MQVTYCRGRDPVNSWGANLLAIEHLYKAKRPAEQFELTNELVIINEQLAPLVATRGPTNLFKNCTGKFSGQFKTDPGQIQGLGITFADYP